MTDLNPNVAPPTQAQLAPATPPRRGGPIEWLWRSNALREAALSTSPEAQDALRRGRGLLEVATRAAIPVDPWRYGHGDPAAVTLLRSSIFWLLRSVGGEAPTLAKALEAAPRAWLDGMVGGAEAQAAVRALLLRDPLEDAAQAAAMSRDEAALLLRVAESLHATVDERDQRIASLHRERIGRLLTTTLAIGFAVVAIVTMTGKMRRGPDLAKGKPIRTSSVYVGFNQAQHMVDANPSEVLFHTSEEVNPWAEIDLGAPTRVGSVEIKNRADCCADRALPLTIEVSVDQQNWTEVARKTEAFSTVRVPIGQTARWVRFSAKKRTWLHLEAVHVYAR